MTMTLRIVLIFTGLLVGCGNPGNDLLEGIADDDHIRVRELLDRGVSADGVGFDGWTPITFATQRQDIRVIRLLIEHDADVNAYDGGGNTSLFWATYHGNYEIARLLLESGADPCRFKDRGKSAIQIANELQRESFIEIYGSCD